MEYRIKKVMREVLNVEIDDSTSQLTCDKWDSLLHLNLIIQLEKEFGLSFKPSEIGEMIDYTKINEVIKSHGILNS